MTEVLLTDPFRDFDLERYQNIEGAHVVYAKEPTAEQLERAEVIQGLPALEQVYQAKNLKWLQSTSAGVDNYLCDKEYFRDKITITSLSGAFGQSISEFALTMCLMLYKHMHLYRDNQNRHLWKDMGRQDSPVGKNLLILGAGNIGCEIAKLFRPFGCHITGVRRTVQALPENFDAMVTLDRIEEELPKADIIIAALPGTPQTHKLMNADRLALLKDTAILINVGRGGLIDCDALAECLQEQRILGAALDVTDPEPLPSDHPLWSCSNAIITPHITGGSFGHLTATEETLFDICISNLKRYLKGEPLKNVVDADTGYRKEQDRY